MLSINLNKPPAGACQFMRRAPGVRLVSVLVDADPQAVAIGNPVNIEWRPATNGVVPVFRPQEIAR